MSYKVPCVHGVGFCNICSVCGISVWYISLLAREKAPITHSTVLYFTDCLDSLTIVRTVDCCRNLYVDYYLTIDALLGSPWQHVMTVSKLYRSTY